MGKYKTVESRGALQLRLYPHYLIRIIPA